MRSGRCGKLWMLTFSLVISGLYGTIVVPGAMAQQVPPQTTLPQPNPEVLALIRKALQAQQAYHWAEALHLYEEARQKANSLTDKVGEAIIVNNIGYVYANTGQPQTALEYYQQALSISRALGDKDGEATSLGNIGGVYANTGQPQKALEYFQQALPVWRAVEDKAEQAVTLNNIGEVYIAIGQPQKALEHFQQALPILREVGDKRGEATALDNIGSMYVHIGQSRKALEYHQQALPIFREVGDKASEATTLNNIGLVYDNLGQPQKALEHFQQALPIFREVGDKRGEATALDNVGGIYADIGQPQKALEFHQQALPIFRQARDKVGEAINIDNIGYVYASIGQTQKALEYFQQALPIFREAGDKRGEATTLDSMGSMFVHIGQPRKALEYHQQALPIFREVGDKASEAITLNNIGTVCTEIGQPQKALEYFYQALPLRRVVGDKRGEARTLGNVGGVYADIGQPQKALEYFYQALPLSRAAKDKAGEATSLNNIGMAYSSIGQHQKALEYYRQALPLRESFYAQVSTSAQIATFQQAHSNLYALYAQSLLQLHRQAEALAVLERGRCLGLLRLINQNQRSLTALLGTDAPAWQEINAQLASLNHKIGSLSQTQSNSAKLKSLRDQLQLTEAQRDRRLPQLIRDHPDFANLFTTRPSTFAQLKQALSQRFPADTLFLEYAVVDDKQTLLFAFSNREKRYAFTLPVGRKTLIEKIEAWVDQIKREDIDELRSAQELYHLLLCDKSGQERLPLKDFHSLVIVSDGPLLDLPFSALIDRSGKRLVEHFSISTPFSLKLLIQPPPQRSAPNTLLAIANPLGPTPALPEAQKHAQAMLSQFPPAHLLQGAEATSQEVLHEIGGYRLIHFAVHGQANPFNGLASQLLLAGKTEEEQALTGADLLEHPMAAQMVVLMACETMQGEKRGGEGLLGLAWAFRAAGCPCVVASQWEVDEGASASLMDGFYAGIRAGKRKDVALQNAMLSVMGKPGWSSPVHWTAFEIMGTPELVKLVVSKRVVAR